MQQQQQNLLGFEWNKKHVLAPRTTSAKWKRNKV